MQMRKEESSASASEQPQQPSPTPTYGTFCVVIEKRLVVASCPLPRGSCIWKHKLTGRCTYSPDSEDLDLVALAVKTGNRIPTPEQAADIKEKLLTEIKKELQ